MNAIYKETFFLSAGETNAEQELSLTVLTSKLIDIATDHANSLGIGNPSMENINAGWILSRLSIEMFRYPKANEYYTVSTWIETFNRHFSERAFSILSEHGETLGYARSTWMVMDYIQHTNVGLTHLSLRDELIDGTVPPIDRQARHCIIVEDTNQEGSGGAMLATAPIFDYRFKYCDIDFYRHVNTVRYVSLLLNRFSLDEHDTFYVKRLELSFLNEARYGMDTQLLRCDFPDGGVTSFLLRKQSDSTPLLYARIFRNRR
ncbi:MAG: hypothetical protein K2F94_03325 [Muribaculaceae bacterium]|nr:hypothetical protein [Muribaculaceae bacterium]